MRALSAYVCQSLFPYQSGSAPYGAKSVTLLEMSREYKDTALKISALLRPLRAQYRSSKDPEERFWLKQRIAILTQVLTQTNELAQLTAHYYERGYWRNEKYTL